MDYELRSARPDTMQSTSLSAVLDLFSQEEEWVEECSLDDLYRQQAANLQIELLNQSRPRLWNTREEHIAMCSSRILPMMVNFNGEGGLSSRFPFCNSVLCPYCRIRMAEDEIDATEEYLESVGLEGLWRVVVEVEGDYDKFRDKLNRFINAAGAKKMLFAKSECIIVHLDREVDFTSYGKSPVYMLLHEIDWVYEIDTVRRKSGNMRLRKEKKKEGLPVNTNRLTVSHDTDRKIIAEACAEAILQTSTVSLPSYSPDLTDDQCDLIQSMYNERDAIMRSEIERLGGEVVGSSSIRVDYYHWGSLVSSQLVKSKLPRFMQKEQLTEAILANMAEMSADSG